MSNNKGNGTKCAECGLRIRGSNHTEGSHHKAHVEKRAKAAAGK